MAEYSEQDLRHAAEFREGVHREALAIVRRTRPDVTEVIDRHPVEDYFQKMWDYPGKWYTVVAIPYGYRNRQALVNQIVRDTLSKEAPEKEAGRKKLPDQPDAKQEAVLNGQIKEEDGPFYSLISEYPDLAVDYFLIKNEQSDAGYESHHKALKAAFDRISGEWKGDPGRATGKKIPAAELFSAESQDQKLNYRKAFLSPPHKNNYTGKDFDRVNDALFPNGTDGLEVYEWTTDWSEYFDDGSEWWGTLCLTVYDKTVDRFAVIMASATD